jgi:hypothetical protein
MTTNNEAFEKWYHQYIDNGYSAQAFEVNMFEAWQAATTKANKRIAELEERYEANTAILHGRTQRMNELKAHINTLCEALESCEEEKVYNGFSYEIHKTFNSEKVKKALSATPAESLQALKEVK